MRVLIDDFRDRPDADIIIRNYASALRYLEMFLFDVTYLMLDNDLGSPDPNDDGYKIACWIEARAQDLGPAAWPETVEVVTGNPPAALKMAQVFGKYYPHQKGRVF